MLPVEYEDDGDGDQDDSSPVEEDLTDLLRSAGLYDDHVHTLADAGIATVGELDRSDDAKLKKAGVSSGSARRKLLTAAQKELGGGDELRSAAQAKGLNNVMCVLHNSLSWSFVTLLRRSVSS